MSLTLKIIRGAAEIGGSQVEILSDNTRLIIDCGLPLNKEINVNILEKTGIFDDDRNNFILISHAHLDHYGAIKYLQPNFKVLLGKATHDLIKISNVFSGNNCVINQYDYFESGITFQLGDFNITAYLNDHSAFDAYSFLIKYGDKTIVYSGDFRNHGRKLNRIISMLNPDYLLLEGTAVTRENIKNETEYEIESKLTEIFNSNDGLNLIYLSSQNIDRLVSLYKACKKAGKTLVIDIYTASILKTMSKYAKLPFPSKRFPEIKVFFTSRLGYKFTEIEKSKYLYAFKKYKISREEIINGHKDIVLLTRAKLKCDIEKLDPIIPGAFIYSLWKGYSDEGETKDFCQYITSRGFKSEYVHTSGHADRDSLCEFVKNVNPKTIIPIHTNNPLSYFELFKNRDIKIVENGELINI